MFNIIPLVEFLKTWKSGDENIDSYIVCSKITTLDDVVNNPDYKIIDRDGRKFWAVRAMSKYRFSAHDNNRYAYKLLTKKGSAGIVNVAKPKEEILKTMSELFPDYYNSNEDELLDANIMKLYKICTELVISQPERFDGILAGANSIALIPGNITGIELVDDKFADEEEIDDSIKISKLSDAALEWLAVFMHHTGGSNPPASILPELENYKLQKELTLYRGMSFRRSQLLDLENQFDNYPLKKGSTSTNIYKRPSSWSTNISVAEDFAAGAGEMLNEYYWLVLKVVASPADVLIDTRLIDDKLKRQLYHSDQKEVILKNGSYKTEVVLIGKGDTVDLNFGWEEETPALWAALEKKMKTLCDKMKGYRFMGGGNDYAEYLNISNLKSASSAGGGEVFYIVRDDNNDELKLIQDTLNGKTYDNKTLFVTQYTSELIAALEDVITEKNN